MSNLIESANSFLGSAPKAKEELTEAKSDVVSTLKKGDRIKYKGAQYIATVDSIKKDIMGFSAQITWDDGKKGTISTGDKIVIVKESKEELSEAKKYDLGAGGLGNGISVWNRAEEEFGDYKIIAHIDNKGNIRYKDKKLPPNIKKEIEDIAKDSLKESEELTEAKAMDNAEKLKFYDSLEKGDMVTIEFGDAFSSGRSTVLKVIKGKTTVGKAKVERITLQDPKKPGKASVKYYLYNRNGKVSLAVGDSGAIPTAMYKNESVNESLTEAKDTYYVWMVDGKAMASNSSKTNAIAKLANKRFPNAKIKEVPASESSKWLKEVGKNLGIKESLNEAKVDVKQIIKTLGDTDFGGSNEEQAKAVQLLKGLAFSEDPLSNKFMKMFSKVSTSIADKLLGENYGDEK